MKLGSKNLTIITVAVAVMALAVGSYFIIKTKTTSSMPTTPEGATSPSSPRVLPPLTPGTASSIPSTSTPLVQKPLNKFTSSFSYPYPVSWIEGQSELTITAHRSKIINLLLLLKYEWAAPTNVSH